MDHSVKNPTYGELSRTCSHKLTFTGNFTTQHKHFDIMPERDSMRRDILNSVLKRTESIMMEHRDSDGVNPFYEDPRDVIGDKPPKPPRKRNVHGVGVASPRGGKEGRALLREQKRKLTKKYEGLIAALMDKCEEHALLISEKESSIAKLKEKLKTVLEYNRLFADENDRLRAAAEDGRAALRDAEDRCSALQQRLQQYELPDKEQDVPSTAVPLVEVCMSCSSRAILLQQARHQNARLQHDMHGLKDVLYRLNVQLSRYQEKLRSSAPPAPPDARRDACDPLDSLLTASLGQRQDATRTEEPPSSRSGAVPGAPGAAAARVADTCGLLSAQALAPLFDAYQENLQEKDNLILDYEKQFENMNKKSKQIVDENRRLADRVAALEDELARGRQSYKKLAVEKETADIEKATLAERAEKAESKLKEVYELYEDKMAAMSRDYETVHREYYAARSALDAAAGQAARLDALRARTVPADLHERRLDHCKRLLEELKHQYGMESERRARELQQAREGERAVRGELAALRAQHDARGEELAAARKNVKLYRKAAVVFRARAQAAAARAARVSRGRRAPAAPAPPAPPAAPGTPAAGEPLRRALQALEKIKLEIKAVKSHAHRSLEELERRLVQQERRAALAQADGRRELERAALALQHKEAVIRSLIDKVADVEEVRLSQTNAHRLQGIVSDSDSPPPQPGGCFRDEDARRKTNT